MIRRKVCLLGAYAVGKTSLVARFVRGIFSERYLTTVGVKIDKKEIVLGDCELTMVLWDLAGEDEFVHVQDSYLRGSSGLLLVADGTRRETIAAALDLRARAEKVSGSTPVLLLLNKADLAAQWETDQDSLAPVRSAGVEVRRTSARTGDGVEAAFLDLGRRMVEG